MFPVIVYLFSFDSFRIYVVDGRKANAAGQVVSMGGEQVKKG